MSASNAADYVMYSSSVANFFSCLFNEYLIQSVTTIAIIMIRCIVMFLESVIKDFIIGPATIIRRALVRFAFFPISVLLRLLYNTTVEESLLAVNIKNGIEIFKILLKYTITTVIFGCMLGFLVGFLLGSVHSIIKIPEFYLTIMPKYLEIVIGGVNHLKYGFLQLLELWLGRVSMVMKNEDGDELFADLLDTYEQEYGPFGESENEIEKIEQENSESVRYDTHTSDVSGISNIFDSLHETGTARTELEDPRNSMIQKGKECNYYDKIDIKELGNPR